MSTLSEQHGVEVPIYQWLGQMGWTPRTSDALKVYQRPFSQPVIERLLVDKVAELNAMTPHDAQLAVNILLNNFHRPVVSEANEQFTDLLKEGVTLTVGGVDRTLRLIDFDNVWANDFTVTRQYYVHGTEMVRPDLVCLVNGIPLIPFEAKQRAQQASDWIKGVRDLSLYQTKIPKMLICNHFAVACNGRMARYGIPGQPAHRFSEWKDLSVDPTPGNPLLVPTQTLCAVKTDPRDGSLQLDIPEYERMKRSVVGLFQPPRILRLLRSYVVNER
jgi:type I restriction enzyme R subunit